MIDERTKELLEWAFRFSSMQLPAEDGRHEVRAMVVKLLGLLDLTLQQIRYTFDDDEVRKWGAINADAIRHLEACRRTARVIARTDKHKKQSARASGVRKKVTPAALEKFFQVFEAQHGTRRGAKKAARLHFGISDKTLKKRMSE